MTLDEWKKKWATGVLEDVPHRMVGCVDDENTEINIRMERHQAPVGEFIKAYVDHLRIPWWRRGPFWKLLEKWMREKLDNLGELRWHWR